MSVLLIHQFICESSSFQDYYLPASPASSHLLLSSLESWSSRQNSTPSSSSFLFTTRESLKDLLSLRSSMSTTRMPSSSAPSTKRLRRHHRDNIALEFIPSPVFSSTTEDSDVPSSNIASSSSSSLYTNSASVTSSLSPVPRVSCLFPEVILLL